MISILKANRSPAWDDLLSFKVNSIPSRDYNIVYNDSIKPIDSSKTQDLLSLTIVLDIIYYVKL